MYKWNGTMVSCLSIWKCLRPLLCILLLAGGVHVFAQQEDSLRVRRDSVSMVGKGHMLVSPDSLSSVNAELPVIRHLPVRTPSSSRLNLSQGPVAPYSINPSPMFRGDYSTSGVWRRAGGGYLVGMGSQTSVPGIGRFNAAAFGWQKQLNDRLQLQLMADALKMNTAHFTGQSFGLSGQMVYQAQGPALFPCLWRRGPRQFPGASGIRCGRHHGHWVYRAFRRRARCTELLQFADGPLGSAARRSALLQVR